jgi:3-oxoacyl-[acyl-carrier protein] reductase
MDMGIKARWALVCAGSKGLGKGCAKALVAEGVNVVITARGEEALQATAAELAAVNPDVRVIAVVGDITTPEGRAAALAACPQVDILVNNAGGPPPGDFRDWDRDDWIKALDANMLTPIELIKARDRRHGRARLRAHRQHHLGRGEGADRHPGPVQRRPLGLTGFVAGLARQTRWPRAT